jgi:predicted DNA binding protein
VTCRVTLDLPEGCWLHEFSTRYDELRLEVVDRFPLTPRRSLAEVRFHGPRPAGWEEELANVTGVDHVEVLEEQELSALCQVIHLTPSWLASARRLRVLWRHPVWVAQGAARWELIASEDRLRELIAEISPTLPGVRIDALLRGAGSRLPEQLTPRQSELLRRAVCEGYFDVPRRISLTELAERLNLSKSTLSERLAVVERKLITREAGVLGIVRPALPEAPVPDAAPEAPCAMAPGLE